MNENEKQKMATSIVLRLLSTEISLDMADKQQQQKMLETGTFDDADDVYKYAYSLLHQLRSTINSK